MALISIFLGILIFFVMVGFVFKIPGLIGKYMGYFYNALSSSLTTIWDMLGKIFGPLIKEIQEATIWSALTVGLTLSTVLAIKANLVHGVEMSAKTVVRDLFRVSFWKGALSNIKLGLSYWATSVKTAFSLGIRNGLKYLGRSLITNAWKIATGFGVGLLIELSITYGLDYISYQLSGKTFSQAINDAIGGGIIKIGPVSFSVGNGFQSLISGAVSGAAIGFMFGGPIGAVVGAFFGAISGFLVGGFIH